MADRGLNIGGGPFNPLIMDANRSPEFSIRPGGLVQTVGDANIYRPDRTPRGFGAGNPPQLSPIPTTAAGVTPQVGQAASAVLPQGVIPGVSASSPLPATATATFSSVWQWLMGNWVWVAGAGVLFIILTSGKTGHGRRHH